MWAVPPETPSPPPPADEDEERQESEPDDLLKGDDSPYADSPEGWWTAFGGALNETSGVVYIPPGVFPPMREIRAVTHFFDEVIRRFPRPAPPGPSEVRSGSAEGGGAEVGITNAPSPAHHPSARTPRADDGGTRGLGRSRVPAGGHT